MSETVDTGALRAEIRALNENVKRLTEVVDENTKQLGRLSALEVSHNHSNDAIERAFKKIEELEDQARTHQERDRDAHRSYDRWIWMASGFATAISIFWTVAGYRVNAVIDDQVRAVTEMRMHIHDDKITNPDQVRAIR